MARPALTSVTTSGSSSAQSSWGISRPAYSSGDLVLFCLVSDDATNVASLTIPNGPNGEAPVTLITRYFGTSGADQRIDVWYYIATSSESAGTFTVTPSASETWYAVSAVCESGDFDTTMPIGGTHSFSGSGNTPTTGNFITGPFDDGGAIFAWLGVDTDPITSTPSGWTELAYSDNGAESGGLYSYDTDAVADTGMSAFNWSIANDTWCIYVFCIRPPGGPTLNYVDVPSGADGWDGYANLSASSITTSSIGNYIGNNAGTLADAFWLFDSVGIAQGATVAKAYLMVKPYFQAYEGVHAYRMYAEDADDIVSSISSYSDYTGRTRTTAFEDFDLDGRVNEEDWVYLNVTGPVQEVVSRGGWASGNSLYIFGQNNSSSVYFRALASTNETVRLWWVLAQDVTVEPASRSLTFTGQQPTVVITDNVLVAPSSASLTLTGQQPTVTVTDHVTVQPGTLSLTLTGQQPVVDVTADVTVEPSAAALSFAGQQPTVVATDHVWVDPSTLDFTLTGQQPVVHITDHVTVQPGTLTLTLTGQQPVIDAGQNVTVLPVTASLTFAGQQPTVDVTGHVWVTPGTVELVFTGQQPVVEATADVWVAPATLELTLTGQQPTVAAAVIAAPQTLQLTLSGQSATLDLDATVQPSTAQWVLTGQQPTVQVSGYIVVLPQTKQLTFVGQPVARVHAQHTNAPSERALAAQRGGKRSFSAPKGPEGEGDINLDIDRTVNPEKTW